MPLEPSTCTIPTMMRHNSDSRPALLMILSAVFVRLLGLNLCESHFEFGRYILPWKFGLLNAAYVTLQGFFWSP